MAALSRAQMVMDIAMTTMNPCSDAVAAQPVGDVVRAIALTMSRRARS
jgi:hypothetical protein